METKTITNKYKGTCGNCNRTVAAGEGQCSRIDGRWVVACTTSDCTEVGNAYHANPALDTLEEIGDEVTERMVPVKARLREALANGADEGNIAEEAMAMEEYALEVALTNRGLSYADYIALCKRAVAA